MLLLFIFLDANPVPAQINGDKAIRDKGERASTLVIGRVTNRPKKHYKKMKPIVEYAARKMRPLGITKGEVRLARNNEEMIELIKKGDVDWITETPYSAIIFNQRTGAEPLVRRWKRGKPDYYSLIFARKESDINNLDDLKGKKIAFEDPGSSTAYFIPFAMFKQQGIDMIELSSPREEVPADKVGYVFAYGELNISTWVYRGIVDAGAFSNLDWTNLNDTPRFIQENLKIITRTKTFPRAVELVRKDLDPMIKNKLEEVLLNIDKDSYAKEILKSYGSTKRFDRLSDAGLGGLDEIREMLKHIDKDIN